MNLPGFLLGFVLAVLYGAAFHFWRGGGFRRLLLFVLLSILGFTAGQIVGAAMNLTIGQVGMLLVGPATVGSLAFLLFGNWLFRQA